MSVAADKSHSKNNDIKKNQASLLGFEVAGTGLEPVTFGL